MEGHICLVQRIVCCTQFIPPSLVLSLRVLVWQYLLHLETSRQKLYYPRSRESTRIHLTPFGCKLLTLTNYSIPIAAAMTTCICLTHTRRFVLYEVTHLLLTHYIYADLPDHPTPSNLFSSLPSILLYTRRHQSYINIPLYPALYSNILFFFFPTHLYI